MLENSSLRPMKIYAFPILNMLLYPKDKLLKKNLQIILYLLNTQYVVQALFGDFMKKSEVKNPEIPAPLVPVMQRERAGIEKNQL